MCEIQIHCIILPLFVLLSLSSFLLLSVNRFITLECSLYILCVVVKGTTGTRDAETDKIAEFRKMVDNIKEGHIRQLEREVNDWNHKILSKVGWKPFYD